MPKPRNPKPPRRLTLSVLGLLAATCSAASLPFTGQVSVTATHDDQVLAYARTGDPGDDSSLSAAASGSRPMLLTRDDLLTLGADLSTEQWLRYPGLGRTTLGLHGGLRHRFGLGYEAPSLSASLVVRDIEARTRALGGLLTEATAAFNHRPVEWFAYGVSVSRDELNARDGFYSRRGLTGAASAEATVASWLSLSASLRQRQGGLLVFGPHYDAWSGGYTALAWWPGRYVDIFGPEYEGYRYNGQTRGVSLSARLSWSETQAITAGFDYSVSERGDARYTTRLVSVGYVWYF